MGPPDLGTLEEWDLVKRMLIRIHKITKHSGIVLNCDECSFTTTYTSFLTRHKVS